VKAEHTNNIIPFPGGRRVELPKPDRAGHPELFSKCLRIHIGSHTREAVDAPVSFRRPARHFPFLLAIGLGAALMGAARLIF